MVNFLLWGQRSIFLSWPWVSPDVLSSLSNKWKSFLFLTFPSKEPRCSAGSEPRLCHSLFFYNFKRGNDSEMADQALRKRENCYSVLITDMWWRPRDQTVHNWRYYTAVAKMSRQYSLSQVLLPGLLSGDPACFIKAPALLFKYSSWLCFCWDANSFMTQQKRKCGSAKKLT